jgi:hypothetical protein
VSKLPYLVAEINAALEVYLCGRTGQQYNRTVFILCDDGAELASKLFLITDNNHWSDKKPPRPTTPCQMSPQPLACPRHPANILAPTGDGGFKNFRDVTTEVRAVFALKRAADVLALQALLTRIESRRDRRNRFFHSTDLLDLTLQPRDCVESFCDLLDYGQLLFPIAWASEVAAVGTMETCDALIRLDRKTYADPGVGPKVNDVFAKWRSTGLKAKTLGCEVVHHAEDMHLRLAIRNGGNALRDRLRALL